MLRCFFFGHSFDRVACSSHTVTTTDTYTGNVLNSVNGTINYIVCSRCGKQSYNYIFPDKTRIEGKFSFISTTSKDRSLGPLLTRWKNGDSNPRINEFNITVYDPLYFSDNFVNSLVNNIHRSGSQYSNILSSPATKSALEEVEKSIKNLQIVIKMQENQNKE